MAYYPAPTYAAAPTYTAPTYGAYPHPGAYPDPYYGAPQYGGYQEQAPRRSSRKTKGSNKKPKKAKKGKRPELPVEAVGTERIQLFDDSNRPAGTTNLWLDRRAAIRQEKDKKAVGDWPTNAVAPTYVREDAPAPPAVVPAGSHVPLGLYKRPAPPKNKKVPKYPYEYPPHFHYGYPGYAADAPPAYAQPTYVNPEPTYVNPAYPPAYTPAAYPPAPAYPDYGYGYPAY
eukprot:NODE_5224_length_967_cov_197.603081_g5012_i0.p1 GENE.NODE_5224_length_967_cov_197.603081_g5012_i0~~NODE_5224_length_967_cov_197.603081_g5012_i0.p1  ORF type:complete len:229 (+),score=36.55 NODE_5224_length_967_cov_197.603081_g5012_i0:54-740(+)